MFPRNKITFYFNLRKSHELCTKRTGIMRENLELSRFSVCPCKEITGNQQSVCEPRGTNGLEPDKRPVLPNMQEYEFGR